MGVQDKFMALGTRSDIVARLRSDILRLEHFGSSRSGALDIELGPIKECFPNGSFPLGAVHEFLSGRIEETTAASGFLAGLLAAMMGKHGTALWISPSRTLFPPALNMLGIKPDRFVFLDLKKENDVLWAMDEALKCAALTAVVGEVRDITFTESRRLQLAVEQSQVTGFIIRQNTRKISTTASASRWKITSIPSDSIDEDLPGIGFPKWKVELLRIRNGRPGVWNIQWRDGRFVPLPLEQPTSIGDQQKAG